MSARKHILIVEDDRGLAADLARKVERLGYDVIANVASGEDAIETAAALEPDLVLMDIRLRGRLDGIEAACAIRSKSDAPVVYLTAYADDETIARAKVTNPVGFLLKPVEERELRAVMELGLNLHEAARLLDDEHAIRRDREQLVMQLSHAVRARDDFLDIAAHELKTPLAALRLHLDAMESDDDGDVKRRARLAAARHQAVRLSRVVDAVMDVSRVTSQHIALEREPLNLASFVRDAVERLRGDAARAGSEVHVSGDGVATGLWDRVALDRIVSNLLANAIKYGGGKPIDVELAASDGVARITIRDHGIGIDREALERIFARYERAVSPRHFGGLGLGLFVARRFAEALGGTISVESQPREGATFTVTLPTEAR